MQRNGITESLSLKKLRNTMKKKMHEFLDFSRKEDKKLFRQHKGTQKCTSTSVKKLQQQLPKPKLKKRAE